MTRALLAAIAAIAAVSFAVPAVAEPYGACAIGTPASPANQCVWDYTFVNNSSSDDYSIWLIQIDVDADTFVVGASGPAGWYTYYDDLYPDHFVTWMYGSSEPQTNDELTGFQAVFDKRPSYQGWSAQFYTAEDPGASFNDSGEVTTIEPGACVALLTGLVGVTAFATRRRRR